MDENTLRNFARNKSEPIEVFGGFLLGAVETFKNLSALTQTDSNHLTEAVSPTEWYPLERLLDIFSILEKKTLLKPDFLFEAGCASIQSWYDNAGKKFDHGGIGHMRAFEDSFGLRQMLRNFDPEKVFTKVLELNPEKGFFKSVSVNFFPSEFMRGVYHQGILVWNDILWLNVDIEEILVTKYTIKQIVCVSFKPKGNEKLHEIINAYTTGLTPATAPPQLDHNTYAEMAWSAKGTVEELRTQRRINSTKTKMLAHALERQHEMAKQLKKTNTTRDRLFSRIGHDLKGPVSYFDSFFSLLLNEYDSHTDAYRKEIMAMLYENSKMVNTLISNLLVWSKSHLADFKPAPKNFLVYEIAAGEIGLITTWAAKKQITVQLNIDEYLMAYADPEMIKIVIRNLLSNAIKFTSPGGRVELLANMVEDGVQLGVLDNGVGIPKRNYTAIFSEDADKTTKGTDNEKGTGLGLVICREFVEKNEGEIWVESELGKGSRFYFSLPLAQ